MQKKKATKYLQRYLGVRGVVGLFYLFIYLFFWWYHLRLSNNHRSWFILIVRKGSKTLRLLSLIVFDMFMFDYVGRFHCAKKLPGSGWMDHFTHTQKPSLKLFDIWKWSSRSRVECLWWFEMEGRSCVLETIIGSVQHRGISSVCVLILVSWNIFMLSDEHGLCSLFKLVPWLKHWLLLFWASFIYWCQ